MSRTFLATLQFDGTGFVGWQRQPAGRSVQMEFERVLGRLGLHTRKALALHLMAGGGERPQPPSRQSH